MSDETGAARTPHTGHIEALAKRIGARATSSGWSVAVVESALRFLDDALDRETARRRK